jgi:acetolactate synthase-1/3 small subunit
VKLMDMTDGPHIEREMLLVKLHAEGDRRDELKRLADIFRGRIIDVSDRTYTVELTGDGAKLDAFLQVLEPGAIIEVVRSGVSGIARGDRSLKL